MKTILKDDEEVLVVREGDLVRKTVRGLNKVCFRRDVQPKEMVDREVEALRRIQGIIGLQQLVERETDDTFTTTYTRGISLKNHRGKLRPEYFEELKRLILICESRGIYRTGINRSDYIITPDNKPAIIDFGNALLDQDKRTKIPGIKTIAKSYSRLRLFDMKRKHT